MSKENFFERRHNDKWSNDHNSEMSLILALERAGYTRDQARRMAEAHRTGAPILASHNDGPTLEDP